VDANAAAMNPVAVDPVAAHLFVELGAPFRVERQLGG
jgi:hypothetical protein